MIKVVGQDYTRLNDLKGAKSWILDNYGTEIIVLEDYHQTHQSSCCGQECQVRTVNFGRIRGCEICDRCIQHEQIFITQLVEFDDSIEYVYDDNDADLQGMSEEGLKVLIKHKLSFDEKKRKKLENEGQMRLF